LQRRLAGGRVFDGDGRVQLAVRIVGSIGRIDQTHLRTGKLTDDEWPRLTEAIEKLRNMFAAHRRDAGPHRERAAGQRRRLARQCGGKLGLIVVDYLQLMSVSSSMSDENRPRPSAKSRAASRCWRRNCSAR
jgi:replicative DNA helicase